MQISTGIKVNFHLEAWLNTRKTSFPPSFNMHLSRGFLILHHGRKGDNFTDPPRLEQVPNLELDATTVQKTLIVTWLLDRSHFT